MNELALRIGDAEREQAAAELGEHFVQGRLSVDEHGERLDSIWAARTRGDLRPVFADLPDLPGSPAPASPWGRSGARSGHRASGLRAIRHALPTPVLLVVALLAGIAVMAHLPFVLLGLLAWLFVRSRYQRPHRWGPPSRGR